MENTDYLFWLWGGLGFIGWLILARNPSKFLFDNLVITTITTVLMAFLLPIWGGPIFLLVVLLTPNKQLCIHCKRVVLKSDTTCPYCQKNLEVLPSELEIIVA